MENVLISEGTKEIVPFEYSERRDLIRAEFPRSLKMIGAHAFYNCRSLAEIMFRTSGTDIGDGAFKNCRRLKKISIEKNTDDLKMLKAILVDVNQESEVDLIYADGHARVVFPYYIDNYEENTPARIVMHVSEGAGTMYRECIYSGDLDYKAYDALFSKELNLDIYDSAVAIAVNRLTFPYRLTGAAEGLYRDYLKKNVKEIIGKYMSEKNIKGINDIINLDMIDKEACESLIEDAREKGETEALCVLLSYYGDKYTGGKKGRYVF